MLVDVTLLLSTPHENGAALSFDLQVPQAAGLAPITEPIRRTCDLVILAPLLDAHPSEPPSSDVLLTAGRELGQALFPDRVADLMRRSLESARVRGRGVRVRIMSGPLLQQLPWEYSVLPPEYGEATSADFIGLMPDVSLVREHEGVPRIEGAVHSSVPLQVLGCVAAPGAHDQLDIARERQLLETSLTSCPGIVLHWTDGGVRPAPSRGIDRADLFHFAGHGMFEPSDTNPEAARETRDIEDPRAIREGGSRDGLLVFDDGRGGEDRAPASEIGIALRELGVRVAVLNACNSATRDAGRWWSSAAAALLKSGVPSVVAMQHPILDTSALAFAGAFYRALADGHSLDEAVRHGRIAIFDRQDQLGWGTPVLYMSALHGLELPKAARASAAVPQVPTLETRPGRDRRARIIAGVVAAVAVIAFVLHGAVTSRRSEQRHDAGGGQVPDASSAPGTPGAASADVELLDLTPRTTAGGHSILDVVMRNNTPSDALLVGIEVSSLGKPVVTATPPRGPLLETSAVYSLLLNRDGKGAASGLRLTVPGHKTERFAILARLGTRNKDRVEAPLTASGDVVETISGRFMLTIHLAGGATATRTIDLTLDSTFGAATQLELGVPGVVAMLSSDDLNTLDTAIDFFTAIADQRACTELRRIEGDRGKLERMQRELAEPQYHPDEEEAVSGDPDGEAFLAFVSRLKQAIVVSCSEP